MKKNKPYYLKMYQEWSEVGYLPSNGLCNSLPADDKLLPLFHPKSGPDWFWGYDGKTGKNSYRGVDTKLLYRKLSPIRRTVLLFMAAMNNEL